MTARNTPLQRFDVGTRMSEMAVHNGTAYLAGQVAADASQDIRGQTQQVLAAIDALLARAGSDKRHILMAQVFLADLADFDGMNEVWDAWVEAGHAPPLRPSMPAWSGTTGSWKWWSPPPRWRADLHCPRRAPPQLSSVMPAVRMMSP